MCQRGPQIIAKPVVLANTLIGQYRLLISLFYMKMAQTIHQRRDNYRHEWFDQINTHAGRADPSTGNKLP